MRLNKKSRLSALKSRLLHVSRLLSACLLVPLLAALGAAPASAQLRSDSGLGEQWRINSTARLLAGLPPMLPAHAEMADTDAWREHSTSMRAGWERMKKGQVAAMTAWRDTAISPTCPAGKTLLYPFSGPDFLNAWWLFPDCETFVMLGLEHIGEVPELESLPEKQRERLLADVRAATTDFFERNYFITENMSRQLHTAHLRGIVPLVAVSMAVAGVDILRIVPNNLPRTPVPAAKGRPMRQLKGVTIEFRAQGSPTIRRMHYFSADVTDKGLAHHPEFLPWLRALGQTTTFIKSASYLLHGREFRMMRETLLDQSAVLVQDDSGLPYSALLARGWQVSLHGKYDVPIPPFQRAFQAQLDQAYKAQPAAPLPFVFGYQYHDARDERSNVMVGRRGPARPASAGRNADASPGTLRLAAQ